MNVQEALVKMFVEMGHVRLPKDRAERFAPKVEAALRAAYDKGLDDALEGTFISIQASRGVTAGIEKLSE